jgi:hypothetical protein
MHALKCRYMGMCARAHSCPQTRVRAHNTLVCIRYLFIGTYVYISTYACSHLRTCACTRARTHIGGIAAHTAAPHRTPTERVSCKRAAGRNGAYRGQSRHGCRVPRADVCVEHRRRLKRLRADNQRSTGEVKNR